MPLLLYFLSGWRLELLIMHMGKSDSGYRSVFVFLTSRSACFEELGRVFNMLLLVLLVIAHFVSIYSRPVIVPLYCPR
ncbi:hypothetical protein BDV18DRAFT_17964 [Aspergillus unguis]